MPFNIRNMIKTLLSNANGPMLLFIFFPFPVWLDVSKLRTIDSMRIHMQKNCDLGHQKYLLLQIN